MPRVSHVAVIYAGDLVSVAEAFAAAARDLSCVVRVRALDEDGLPHTATHPSTAATVASAASAMCTNDHTPRPSPTTGNLRLRTISKLSPPGTSTFRDHRTRRSGARFPLSSRR